MAVYPKEIEEVGRYQVTKEKRSKFTQQHLDAMIDLLHSELDKLRGTAATQHKVLSLYEFALEIYKLKGK